MKLKRIIPIIALAAVLWPAQAEGARRRKAAKPKVTAEELMAQARQAFYDYNVDLANEKIAALRADKKSDANATDSLEARVNRLDEMIQRVEDIAVIDSINVGREDFFRHYRLSPASGSLLSPAEFGGDLDAADPTVVYMPEDGSFMIWGTDEGLVESGRLTDGSWEMPAPLGEVLNAGGTANYPFQLADGTTLYYATDGDDSLGGLDLYISQRNRDGFAAPQNMGMPYNSPFDDYMLAIDEETGAGWFATDRNQLGDLITIYVFVPADTRVNLDVDSSGLTDRARIASIASPLTDEQQSLLARIARIPESTVETVDNTPDFVFAMPDGRVYTRWSDFRSAEARRMMENYVDALDEDEADSRALTRLRASWRPGNPAVDDDILQFEKKLRSSRTALKKMANQIIVSELQ